MLDLTPAQIAQLDQLAALIVDDLDQAAAKLDGLSNEDAASRLTVLLLLTQEAQALAAATALLADRARRHRCACVEAR